MESRRRCHRATPIRGSSRRTPPPQTPSTDSLRLLPGTGTSSARPSAARVSPPMMNRRTDMDRLHRSGPSAAWPGALTIVCLSHLRWDFVYQRPQHLLTRAAHQHRVLYVEEPKRDVQRPYMEVREDASGVSIPIPHLAATSPVDDLRALLETSLQRRTPTNWCCGTTRRWRWHSRITYTRVRWSTTAWTSSARLPGHRPNSHL